MPLLSVRPGLDLAGGLFAEEASPSEHLLNPTVSEEVSALNLIDLAKDYLTPDVLSKISGLIGESPASTQKAMAAVVPSLAGIACNEVSTPGGASKLMGLFSSSGLDTSLLNNFGAALGGGSVTDGLLKTGSNLVSGLLGDKVVAVASVIGNFAGIQGSSATKLLSIAAPLL